MKKISLLVFQGLSLEDVKFLSFRCFDDILKNESKLSKSQIIEKIRNLADEIERFC